MDVFGHRSARNLRRCAARRVMQELNGLSNGHAVNGGAKAEAQAAKVQAVTVTVALVHTPAWSFRR